MKTLLLTVLLAASASALAAPISFHFWGLRSSTDALAECPQARLLADRKLLGQTDAAAAAAGCPIAVTQRRWVLETDYSARPPQADPWLGSVPTKDLSRITVHLGQALGVAGDPPESVH